MNESRERVYEECQLTDVDFLTKTFKDGINVTKEDFAAFLKTATGRSIDECFPNMSVMFVLNHGDKRYALGYYELESSPLFTINMIDIDTHNPKVDSLIKEWLTKVNYGPHHALLAAVSDIYTSMNDTRSWADVAESRHDNDLISMVALAMAVQRNIDDACTEILARRNYLTKVLRTLVDEPQYREGFLAVYPNVSKLLGRAHFCLNKISDLDFPQEYITRIKVTVDMLAYVLEGVNQVRAHYEDPKDVKTFSNLDSFSEFVQMLSDDYTQVQATPEPTPEPEPENKQESFFYMMPCPPGIH